jgi:hypothetical protein
MAVIVIRNGLNPIRDLTGRGLGRGLVFLVPVALDGLQARKVSPQS